MNHRLRRLAARPTGLARGRLNRGQSPDSKWFWDHYEWAPAQIADFCRDCGLDLEALKIADVGCGDGIMSLGLTHRVRPRSVVAFDIVPTDTDVLLSRARAEGVVTTGLPKELEFRRSETDRIPTSDGEFDFAYSWSAFEHIASPVAVLQEIRRVLRPTGHFFLQLWPFFLSAKGSHLWDWFPEDFHHLTTGAGDIVSEMRESSRHPAELTDYMAREFGQLNRITVTELQRSVLAAGFEVRKFELLSEPTILRPELARYSWCDLAIGGIKLLAAPAR